MHTFSRQVAQNVLTQSVLSSQCIATDCSPGFAYRSGRPVLEALTVCFGAAGLVLAVLVAWIKVLDYCTLDLQSLGCSLVGWLHSRIYIRNSDLNGAFGSCLIVLHQS